MAKFSSASASSSQRFLQLFLWNWLLSKYALQELFASDV